jgi:ribosomal-protein-alanine N-acetyltransferase
VIAPDLTLIETERLWMTGWREDQVGDLLRLHGDAATAQYLSADGHPWSPAECAENVAIYIDTFRTHRMGKLRLIRKSDGAFVGRAGFGLMPPDDTPEIGYALLPEHRGQGYAGEAAGALRDWLFRETDRAHFIGFADVRNTASRKVLRGIGMIETHIGEIDGITGQFHIMHRPA